MSGRYLLDTNTASYIIKGNIPRVRERLVEVPMAQIAISAVTEAELLFGAARKREAVRLQAAIEEFLARGGAPLGFPRSPAIREFACRLGTRWHPCGKLGLDDRGTCTRRGSHLGY